MSILREIQAALMSEEVALSTVLLKLRFLASRLGSEPLEDWVKYEAEGYPDHIEVPGYRIVGVSFKGNWSGSWSIQNAPIPPYLIEQYASADWTSQKVLQSIASVEELAKKDRIGIDASNLILLLQGKIYKGLTCTSISAEISPVAMKEIKQAVRSRIFELTIELDKRVPEAVEVTLEKSIPQKAESEAAVTQIFNQTVYGNITHVTATDGAQVSLAITAGDNASMIGELVKAGLPEQAAKEFTEIIASEKPEKADQPLGRKALDWIKTNAPKAAGGAWKVGSSILKDVLTEAAMKYYGLKP